MLSIRHLPQAGISHTRLKIASARLIAPSSCMPSKRDARNNIAPSEFAYLGLHQAALSGNVGLVQYALSKGHPVDAVWDGISPLHAAAAGGSEHVARLLLEKGADVSFARLPKSERELKTRTPTTPSCPVTAIEKGADTSISRIPRGELELKPRSASSSFISTPDALLNAGSTPLHFACAHNNVAVARLLLSHGAAPHIRDRCGVTPLDLLPPASRDSSSDLLRTVIREYYEAEKAKEKELQKSHIRFYGKAAAVLGFPREDEALGGRVGAKRSFDTLLSKSPKHLPAPLTTPTLSASRRALSGTGTPPPSPRRPSGTASERMPPSPTSPSPFTFGSATPQSSGNVASIPGPVPPDCSPPSSMEQRRPSLPHLFKDSSPSPPASMLPSTAEGRPHSAGSGSQPPSYRSQPQPGAVANAFSIAGHSRPRTKRSLLSLFKKGDQGQQDTAADEHEREAEKEWAKERYGAGTMMPPMTAPPVRSSSRRRGPESEKKADIHTEVRTAPAERTIFPVSNERGTDCVLSDDEEYGIPLNGTPDSLPQELPVSPIDTDDEDSDGELDEDQTVEDGAEDPTLELDRASTGATVRPRGPPIPPPHAEAWYRDRVESAHTIGVTFNPPESNTTPPPTSPRPRPGILRSDLSVRHTGSRGALRFEARQQGGREGRTVLREKDSHSSLLSVESRSRSRSASDSASGGGEGKQDLLAVDNRLRGNSVSSASTDASVPAGSQVSQDTTGTSTSSVPPLPSLPDSSRVREGYADALLDSSEGEDEGHALKLNIHTVSNHAQAEALVQKAAKEILELNAGVVDAEPSPNLSAQLAAYGETLQLERRFARGEAQRYKSKTRLDAEGNTDEEGEQKREDEQLRKSQEKMVWSQREMEKYAKDREAVRERKGFEIFYADRDTPPVGAPLGRTASLEKELEVGAVSSPPRPRQQRRRRPHTSDSVASGTGAPPRFGHSSTHSSSSVLRGSDAGDSIRIFNKERRPHHPSRSVSAHPRAESLDYERKKASTRENEPVPSLLARHDSRDDPDPKLGPPVTSRGPSLAMANRFAISPPVLALDEFGASTSSIRPPKPRFGGLRSLFGKGK